MLSFDTNLAVYAANSSVSQHDAARDFITTLAVRTDVVICELMLVELYLKLRNSAIFPSPMSAAAAVAWCGNLRNNRNWQLVESAPVMEKVWGLAAVENFAFRRVIDLRLALTLRHFGVTDFATTNKKGFEKAGFHRVWNPLVT